MNASSRRATEIVLLAVLLSAGLWMLAVRPAQQEQAELDGALAGVRQANARAVTRVAELEDARRRAPEHRRAVRRLSMALPSSGGVADFVRELDREGAGRGVRLDAVGLAQGAAPAPGVKLPPGATTEAGPIAGVPFDLEFRGDFFDLARLVRRAQDGVTAREGGVRVRGRLVTVQSISLTVPGRGEDRVEAAIAAVAHVAPEVGG